MVPCSSISCLVMVMLWHFDISPPQKKTFVRSLSIKVCLKDGSFGIWVDVYLIFQGRKTSGRRSSVTWKSCSYSTPGYHGVSSWLWWWRTGDILEVILLHFLSEDDAGDDDHEDEEVEEVCGSIWSPNHRWGSITEGMLRQLLNSTRLRIVNLQLVNSLTDELFKVKFTMSILQHQLKTPIPVQLRPSLSSTSLYYSW